MALITSCPNCGTSFRVTPLHLQAHGGDVRCGRCSHVFNAFSRLSTLQEPETSDLTKETASEIPEAQGAQGSAKPTHEPAGLRRGRPVPPPHSVTSHESKSTAEPDRPITRQKVPLEAATPEAQVRETAIAREVPETIETTEATQANFAAADRLVQGGPVPQTTEEGQPAVEPVPEATSSATETQSLADRGHAHEFGGQAHEAEARDAADGGTSASGIPSGDVGEAPVDDAAAKERAARQGRPSDRAREPGHQPEPFPQATHSGTYAFENQQSPAASFAWSLGSLLLLIIFTGQTIYFYRTDLAAVAPETKPYLEQYCEFFGCSLSPSQQKQLLDIESSDMRIDPMRPNIITLNATVHNHAAYPQALPLFELTFIDAQNRALASRIFRPDMYLEPGANLNGAIAPGNELNVRLRLDATDLSPAGYRLSLLYPPS